ncbi:MULTISPECIES: hypothetical protein [unclassified Bacillus (in: firmicutes)]|uniref:hypothetical protein n=1 Tax=unclassified Bacillus (in: firmicutes) TaxID=185979 RepID=UPI0023D98D54|nr:MULTISPECIES: hypothetical protein [unclassified Bacillus (in: firmicutes)]MDF2017527.1 hypothetical protein [Bacillus sp. Cr_R3]MDF2030898.1 hypothetical protein [Bacillus sp. Cr_R16]HDR7437549.1 hypothetical protein [Bacillus anthracis]
MRDNEEIDLLKHLQGDQTSTKSDSTPLRLLDEGTRYTEFSKVSEQKSNSKEITRDKD